MIGRSTIAFLCGLAAALVVLPVATPWVHSADRRAPPQADVDPGRENRPAPHAKLDPDARRIAALRAGGPDALDELRMHHFGELVSDSPSPAVEAEFDAVAGQRYATVSWLYWYTDLELAKQAARQLQRPILALRLLGDLRDDLSCTDSRLIRTTVYANLDLATFLRSNFVLYWSSVRPVPRVTYDLGDGHTLVRTTKGNSTHYVLDAEGHVLDVLPGLYAPVVFRHQLEASLALARQLRGKTDAERIAATVEYHRVGAAAAERTWLALQGVQGALLAMRGTEIPRPDRGTLSLPMPSEILFGDDDDSWSAIGGMVWGNQVRSVLDRKSRALITRVYRAGPQDLRINDATLADMLARLERHVIADTAFNEFWPRQRIRRQIVEQRQTDFWSLDGWIYEMVFGTEASDPWLGLHPRTEFTGLPGDGAVMR